MLIPRNGKTEDTKFFKMDYNQFIFHHSNMYEEGEKVFIDSVCMEGGIDFDITTANVTRDYFKAREFGGTGSWTGFFRHELDLKSGSVERYRLSDRGCEFPQINADKTGKKYQFAYVPASGNEGAWYQPFQALMKVDV